MSVTIIVLLACLFLIIPGKIAMALPKGADIIQGDVTFTEATQKSLHIQASHNSIIDYQSFDISAPESVQFIQPNAQARVFNRIIGNKASYINGSLQANGQVYLINSSGIFFGDQTFIDVAGLHAAAGALSNEDFLNNNDHFTNIQGTIINDGQIHANSHIYLVAREVINRGDIIVNHGMITLASGEDVLIGNKNSQIFIKITPTNKLLNSSTGITNSGRLQSNNGRVLLAAGDVFSKAIVQTGHIEAPDVEINSLAPSLTEISGQIIAPNAGNIKIAAHKIGLYDALFNATGKNQGGSIFIGNVNGQTAQIVHIDKGSLLNASALENGDGGEILVWADHWTRFEGKVMAHGGTFSGDGGFAEISGAQNLYFHGTADIGAKNGRLGTLLFDPATIEITASASEPEDTNLPSIAFANLPAATTISNTALQALSAGQNVRLESTSDIIVNGAVNFTTDNGGSVELISNENIIINADLTTSSSLTITADNDTNGLGNIQLNANLRTINNTLSLTAIDFIRGGGTETLDAGSGAINLNMSFYRSVDIGTGSTPGAQVFDNNFLNDITAGSLTIATGGALLSNISIDGVTDAATDGINGLITLSGRQIDIENTPSSFHNGLVLNSSWSIDVDQALTTNAGGGSLGQTTLNSSLMEIDVNESIITNNGDISINGDDFSLNAAGGYSINAGSGDIALSANNDNDIKIGASAGTSYYFDNLVINNLISTGNFSVTTRGTGSLIFDGIANTDVDQFDAITLSSDTGNIVFSGSNSNFDTGNLTMTSNADINMLVNVDNDGLTTLTAADMDISGGSLNTGTGMLTIDATGNGDISLGSGTSGLQLSTAELSNITSAGGVTFDTDSTGDIYVDAISSASTSNFNGTVTLNSADDILYGTAASTFANGLISNAGGENQIGQDITTSTGAITLNGANILTDDVNLTASTANQDITLANTIDSLTGNNYQIDINANGNGDIYLNSQIGATDPLSMINISPGATGMIYVGATQINTIFTQHYQGALVLSSDTTLTSSTAGGTITFDATVDSDGTNRDLTINSAENVIFNDDLGLVGAAGTGFDLLDINAAGTIGGPVATVFSSSARGNTFNVQSGTDGTGDLILSSAATIQAANITLEAGDGSGGSASAATIDLSTNNPQFLAFAGGATSPASFTYRTDAMIDDSQIPLVSQLGAGPSGVAVSLASQDANIYLDGNLNRLAGSTLTLNGQTGVAILNDDFTGSNSLASIDITGNTQIEQDITTSGNMDFRSAVTLTGDLTLTGADINFLNALDGAQNLTLSSSGATVLSGAVGAITPIGGSSGVSIDIQSTGTTEFASTVASTGGILQSNSSGLLTFRDNFTFGTQSVSNFNGDVLLDNLSSLFSNTINFGNSGADTLTLSGAAIVLTSRSANDDIIINAAIEPLIAGSTDFTLTAGTGNITVNGSIGAIREMSDLTITGNSININGKLNAADTINISSLSSITITAPIDPVSITLSSADDINISAANLADNLISITAGSDGSGSFNLNAGGSLTVTDPAPSSDIVINTGNLSGNIILNGNVTANNKVTINAPAGNVLRNGGLITAPTIDLDASSGMGSSFSPLFISGSNISADNVSNDVYIANTSTAMTNVTSLTNTLTGALSFTQTGGNSLSVDDASTPSGDITLSNAGAHLITNSNLSGSITTHSSGNDISLTTTGSGNIYLGNVQSIGGTSTVTSANDIQDAQDDIALDLKAYQLILTAPGDIGGMSLVGNTIDSSGDIEIDASHQNFNSGNNVYYITDLTSHSDDFLRDTTPLAYYSKNFTGPKFKMSTINSKTFLIGKTLYASDWKTKSNHAELKNLLLAADELMQCVRNDMPSQMEIRSYADIFKLKSAWQTLRMYFSMGTYQYLKDTKSAKFNYDTFKKYLKGQKPSQVFKATIEAIRILNQSIKTLTLSHNEQALFYEGLTKLIKPAIINHTDWLKILEEGHSKPIVKF